MDIDALQGRWTLLSINDKEVVTDQDVWFELSGTLIVGFDGCNNFGGDLSSSRPLRKSQRGCEEDTFEFPLDFSRPVEQLNKATLDGNELALPLTEIEGVALFIRQ